MKKLLLVFLIPIICFFPYNGHSQNNNAGAAAIAGGLVAGAVIGAVAQEVAIENYKEQIELMATEWTIKNRPNLNSFNLKVAGINMDSKTLDPSKVSVNVIMLSPFNPISGKYLRDKAEVLLFMNSKGWWNEYGIDFTRIVVKTFSRNEWNNLISKYIFLASRINIEESINKHIEVKEQNGTDIVSIFNFKKKKNVYLKKTDKIYQFSEIEITKNSVRFKEKNDIYGLTKKNEIIPFINKLNGDSYLIDSYSDDIKIIYNERVLGLYLKEVRELFQIKRKIVNRITTLLNY